MKNIRADHYIISKIVKNNSRILDIGCADGQLLHLLEKEKNVSGQGIEINHDKVETCLKKGLSVIEEMRTKKSLTIQKNHLIM